MFAIYLFVVYLKVQWLYFLSNVWCSVYRQVTRASVCFFFLLLMSTPLIGIVEGSQCNVTVLASATSAESICQNSSALKERNYMGLSDCSSIDSSAGSCSSGGNNTCLNLKATELRLGLPGSQSPERSSEFNLLNSTQLDEKPFFPLHPSNEGHCSSVQRNIVSGNKRGFSDAIVGFSEDKSEVNVVQSPGPSPNLELKAGSTFENFGLQAAQVKDVATQKGAQEKPHGKNDNRQTHKDSAKDNSSAPATKQQIVGWPPIRSFRKNSLATTSKNTKEVDGKLGPSALFIKVSMDGAPYLRKVDLRNYPAYRELSSALEKMFSCFAIGQYGVHGTMGRDTLSESKLKDLLNGSEYVLTYEDKDGDWMLVGDVPWEMFINTCKRLRIMKGTDAIGLAPRTVEKCKNRN